MSDCLIEIFSVFFGKHNFFHHDNSYTNNETIMQFYLVVSSLLYTTAAKMAEQFYHTVHICKLVCICHSIGIL